MSVDVKICGMTNAEDVAVALEAGADYIGFVLYPKSPRAVTAEKLRRILDGLGRPCRAVGVFVNEPRESVERVAADCGLYAVQLHGDERAEAFADYGGRLWRAVGIGGAGDGSRGRSPSTPDMTPPWADWRVERYVVDAVVPGLYGGTGCLADWKRAAVLAGAYPVMLAGGLTPENVREAVAAVHPLGVDVAGGVEREPGRKDHARIRAFIGNAKHE